MSDCHFFERFLLFDLSYVELWSWYPPLEKIVFYVQYYIDHLYSYQKFSEIEKKNLRNEEKSRLFGEDSFEIFLTQATVEIDENRAIFQDCQKERIGAP